MNMQEALVLKKKKNLKRAKNADANANQMDTKSPLGVIILCQLILLFSLFLLLFIGLTAFFGIIHKSHYTISTNFYLYL